MKLTINGQSQDIPNVQTVGDLVRHFDAAPVRVAVEVNRDLVPRACYEESLLSEGDEVEVVTFVGGG